MEWHNSMRVIVGGVEAREQGMGLKEVALNGLLIIAIKALMTVVVVFCHLTIYHIAFARSK